ncbi:P-loop nucleotide/nucleoside kinase family protein [Microlunatus parietis]|uniref:Putative kinase n=1 Tax=Microlunatus parietis TaxID=682979 RepID=A0A7Y9LEE3_9ACTN|nr:hypothetical protein [Microlunatus parietis]NYE72961.1 putative kinase [Microlunatus parietis]
MSGTLFVLAGGQAAGKSTLCPELVRLAAGPIVLDMDELLDDGVLLGHRIGPDLPPDIGADYDRLWTRVVDLVRRAGHPVIFLCPTPRASVLAAGEPFGSSAHWARLACDRAVREQRLLARGWSAAEVAEFLEDPGHAEIEALIPREFRTDRSSPTEIARDVLAWVDETQSGVKGVRQNG